MQQVGGKLIFFFFFIQQGCIELIKRDIYVRLDFPAEIKLQKKQHNVP